MIWFIVIVLATFWVASALNQFKKLGRIMARYDRFQLLPNYCFFAPIPYSNDFRLVYKVGDEEQADWKELDMYKVYSFRRVLWNPFKYYNKGMIDTCQMLHKEYEVVKDKEKMLASSHHINILLSIFRYLKYVKKTPCSSGLKFAIVTSVGTRELKVNNVIFDSNFQKI